MAKMLMPDNTVTGEGTLEHQIGGYKGDNKNSNRYASRFDLAPSDPRLNMDQRLDQRYSNYTYGKDSNYAQENAESLQGRGTTAAGQFTGQGDTASNRSLAAYGRDTPETNYYAANGALNKAGFTGDNQNDLYRQLMAYAAQGPGPSAAQAQLQSATNQNMGAQLALARSGRGMGGSAAAMGQAAFQNAGLAANAANQSAMLRAQEDQAWKQQQLAAYGMGGDVLSQQGQLQLGIADRGMAQSEFLTDAELRAQAQNDQAALAYGDQALAAYGTGATTDLAYEAEARANYENQLDAGIGYETNLSNQLAGKMQLESDREARDDARNASMWGTGMGLAEGVGAYFAD
jgi:hypothetical protein